MGEGLAVREEASVAASRGGDETGNELVGKGLNEGAGDEAGDDSADRGTKRGTGDETGDMLVDEGTRWDPGNMMGNKSVGGGIHVASLVHRGSNCGGSSDEEARGGDGVGEVLQALDEGKDSWVLRLGVADGMGIVLGHGMGG